MKRIHFYYKISFFDHRSAKNYQFMENLTFFKGLESSLFSLSPLSRRERGMGQLAHFISQGLSPSLNSSALSKGERGMGSFGHFQFPHVLSQYKSIYLSLGERGMGQLAHFISLVLSRSHNSSALPQGERGIGRLSHILFLRRPPGYGRRP